MKESTDGFITYWQIFTEWLRSLSDGEATVYGGIILAILGFIWLMITKGIPKLYNHFQTARKAKPPEITQGQGLLAQPKPEFKSQNTPPIKPLPHTDAKLIGRRKEQAMLTRAWKDTTNIVVLVALGGTGKTALLNTWQDKQFNDSKDHGAKKIFTWSFYSQGAAEDKQTDATPFFNAALKWFGYSDEPIKSDHEKGLKLAELIDEQKSLLILDGLEPLQHPPAISDGRLKDLGLRALLQQLAVKNQGLCVISSRQEVEEIKGKSLVITHELEQLETDDAIELLKDIGIQDSKAKLIKAVEEYQNHALSLNLLGHYVKLAYEGDIRQRDKIPYLQETPQQGKHAQRVIAAYETQLKGQAELIVLYLLGLFDRPVSKKAFQVLLNPTLGQSKKGWKGWFTRKPKEPSKWIKPLSSLSDIQYAQVLENLRQQKLLNQPDPQQKDNLDTHPLIREYFAKRFKSAYPDAWQQAHQALYEYYKGIEDIEEPKSADEMSHLFAAVAHGCAAGLHQEVVVDVYWNRIRRKNEDYIARKLGAFSTELSILSHFFDQPWLMPTAGLEDHWKAGALNWVAFRLRALGRLKEAVEPFQAGLDMRIEQENWREAAKDANNLSELQLTRGDIPKAKAAAQQGVELADRSSDIFWRMGARTTLADAYHQAGVWTEAQTYFEKAEALQLEHSPSYPQLYSLQGFRYCDLLLTTGQWKEVQQRASQWKEDWDTKYTVKSLLSLALMQLTLGRSSIQAVYLECLKAQSDSTIDTTQWQNLTMPPEAMVITQNDLPQAFTANQQITKPQQIAINWLNQAVEDLRKSGQEDYLPRGLLARANYARFAILLEASATELALQDLQETHEIAQRSGMKLHLTDYHLEATRLALTINQDIHNQTARQHLNQAKTLIQQTGYHRRDGEVTYLEGLLKQ